MDPSQAFIVQRSSDLRRIARQTRGEHSLEDVAAEVWLMAERIATKRGFAFNFSHRCDQEQLLAWLYNHLVKYADKRLRYAVKLDKDWDNEDAESTTHSMARLLAAPDSFDPAVLLLKRETGPDPLLLTRHSYSQASAYVILLCRFDWDTEELATHLHIVTRTLLARLRWCGAWTRWQASLFDGLQVIALDFEPTKARALAPRMQASGAADAQQTWPFPMPSDPAEASSSFASPQGRTALARLRCAPHDRGATR